MSAVIVPLQYLRGAAALLVVIDHAISTIATKSSRSIDLDFAWELGDIGVAIFFVISGAIMIIGNKQNFKKDGKTGDDRSRLKKFLLKRLIRIAPLYWITTLIYATKVALQGNIDLERLALSLLLIPHQSDGMPYGRPLYQLGWTLQYEIFFYAIFSIALTMRYRAGLTFACFTIFSGVALFQILGENNEILSYLFKPIILYFVAGMFLGHIHNSQSNTTKISFEPTARWLILSVNLALIAHLYLWSTAENKIIKDLSSAAVACLTVGLCLLSKPCTPTDSMARGSVWLGNITYSLYLTHSFILGPSGSIASKIWPAIPTEVFVMATLPAALILAHTTYVLIERPILNSAKKYIAT